MKAPANLRWNQHEVQAFQDAVHGCNFKKVAKSVRSLIERGSWRERWFNTYVVRCLAFREFITAKYPQGCGFVIEDVEKIIRDDPETMTLWREAITAPAQRMPKSNGSHNNVITSKPATQGNSKSYTLTRLKEQREDLFKRVVAGELSANAAAIPMLGAQRRVEARIGQLLGEAKPGRYQSTSVTTDIKSRD